MLKRIIQVNCEVRSIAAQTDCSSIRNSTNQNRLHIDDHDEGQYDSSGSFDSTSSRNMNRRRRKPATKSVASGGFEYLENIVCYDRTCLRNRFKLFMLKMGPKISIFILKWPFLYEKSLFHTFSFSHLLKMSIVQKWIFHNLDFLDYELEIFKIFESWFCLSSSDGFLT